jgi:ubiquitin-conjugating enzyme E2 Z
MASSDATWDPDTITPHKAPISADTKRRLHQELTSSFEDPTPGITVFPDESDLLLWHALIIGPEDSPYAHGFFYFVIRCRPDYPFSPPMVKLMTTGGGTVRFNPNLYKNGKVQYAGSSNCCMSTILALTPGKALALKSGVLVHPWNVVGTILES